MNQLSDARSVMSSSLRHPRHTVGTISGSMDQLPIEPKRLTLRSGKRKRSASARSPKEQFEVNFRGGNELLLRTAVESIPELKPTSRLHSAGFGVTFPTSSRLNAEVGALLPKRAEFSFLEIGMEGNKYERPESSSTKIDVCTCPTETFDKWLISTLSAIPPNTSSTLSLRSGAVASHKAQKKFIFRETILNNIFNLIQSALEVLQRFQLEILHNQSLLDAYYAALEEDALDRKQEAGKFTAFHFCMREKKRMDPILRYQMNSSEIESRINKVMHVIHRLEVLEGLHAFDSSSDSPSTEDARGDHRSSSDPMYGDDVNNNSDEDAAEVLQDGSTEKEKLLLKMKRLKVLKILAKKSKGLQECVELPLHPHEITSRLRNDLVLPFCARVLSLKEISTKKGREDKIRSFVEWYVNKMVDPFAMAQLLRIVPMEYVVTTTCRLVSVCDSDLSLRATQALPDFSHVILRAIREGREEAFSQLVLSPSVAFLRGLQNPLISKIFFYAALLLGNLNVLRRVLSCGFFHPQVLLVLLFFNVNWEVDDCANYLLHQLKLCYEMSDLRSQLMKQRRNDTTGHRNGISSAIGTSSINRVPGSRLGESGEPLRDTKWVDSNCSERWSANTAPHKDKVYNLLETTLKSLFSDDMDGPASTSTAAEQFIYKPLNILRNFLEMKETTHREVHAFASSLATTGINPTGGKDPTGALFHDVGVDIHSIGGALRRELEGLRWHSYFVGKNKGYPSMSGLGETMRSECSPQLQDSCRNSPVLSEEKKLSAGESREDSFGNLLRGCWLDALLGRPLTNVMLPTFSTKWLRRIDSRSYLPIAPTLSPLLIRSDCSINLLEGGYSKIQLYSSDEAVEVKEVKEAEDQRGVRTLSTMEFLSVPMRNIDTTEDARDGHSPTEGLGGGQKSIRKNRNRQDAYEGNYYFEVHVSLDYILASSGNAQDTESESFGSASGSYDKSIPSLKMVEIPRGATRMHPSVQNYSSLSSLVLGFCSENSEANPAGVVGEQSKELGILPGSGGISLHVVGYREGVEVLQEDDGTVKQVDEAVIKIIRHQDGKTFPVVLPSSERWRHTRGAPRRRKHSTMVNSTSNLNIDHSTFAQSTDGPVFHSHKSSFCSSLIFSENDNSYRGDRSSVIGGVTSDFPQASFVFLQFMRKRTAKNREHYMINESYSQLSSPTSVTDARSYGSTSCLMSARSYHEEEPKETIFPYTRFITEKEFRDWQRVRTKAPATGGGTGFSGALGVGTHRSTLEAIHEISQICLDPSVTPERKVSYGDSVSINNSSLFGHVGLSLGFFVDLKRKVVSLSVNGIPAGTPFSRFSSSPMERLYPAATVHSSVSMIEFLLKSEENSSLFSTPPIMRFAFDEGDLVGDRLWEVRQQTTRLIGEGEPIHSPLLSLTCPEKDDVSFTCRAGQSSSISKGSTNVTSQQPTVKGITPLLSSRSFSSAANEGPPLSKGSSTREIIYETTSYLPRSFLKSVKLLDKKHKFKLILELLSTPVESADLRSSSEFDGDVHRKGPAGNPLTNSPPAQKKLTGMEVNMEGSARAGEPIGELQWNQRTHKALNHLSAGGFHDFIFFPSIHIRRRSDDDWKDLQYNGVSIIPERSVLSPLCAALTSRQPVMALAIASNPMTNMYHTSEAAVRQRRLSLLGACALGYAQVVQVLLERMPVYEVLSLFSIQIQREEWEELRREHRKRNILISKVGMGKDNKMQGGEGNTQLPKRNYAVTPVGKLDPQKMYASKGSQYTPIHCALLGGNHTVVVTVLLNYLYRALAFKPYNQLSISYCKEFRDAEAAGNIFYVGKTYPHLKDAVNVSSKAGETALLMATRMNNATIAKRLLAFGAIPHCQDRISRAFALEIACSNQFLPIAQALFSTNAYCSPLMLNHAGVATPLCWCAINNLAEMIPPLLKNGADPMKGLDGNSPLLLAVTFRSEEAALCLLRHCAIAHNAEEVTRNPNIPMINVNDVDARTQCTALHIACELGMVEVVRALLHSMAALTVVAKGTYATPLHTAILNCKKEAALTLLEFAKDQLRRYNTVMDINAIDKNGNTPLHLAVRAGMAEVVEYIVAQFSSEEIELLSKGHSGFKAPLSVDFMHRNNQGKIPLLVAIQFHEVKCAELIIAYSVHENIRNPGGTVINGTCMAILQAISAGLDEVVLLLLSYPQYQATAQVRENFMKTYTAQRNTFDQMEAQQLIEAKKAREQAARNARKQEDETEYRYFPLIRDEEEEEEEEEEERTVEEDTGISEKDDSSPPSDDGNYFVKRVWMSTKKSNGAQGKDTSKSLVSGEHAGNTDGKPVTNYTGSLISRTKAFCPTTRKGANGGWMRGKGIRNKRRGGEHTNEKRPLYHGYEGQTTSGRSMFVKELFARNRSKLVPEIALKLLLRGFAFPELFVMLEEVAAQSLVVGIQSPSAMVNSESMLGFLKEHFEVNILPSNAVKFARDLLEHIISMFENMSTKKEEFPSWYYERDQVNEAIRRYPPFCQNIVRIIRLYGKQGNSAKAIEHISAAIKKKFLETRLPFLHMKNSPLSGKSKDRTDETLESSAQEELEKLFVTPFRYTVLQLVTNLRLGHLVSFFLHDVRLSPFYVPIQVAIERQQGKFQTREEGKKEDLLGGFSEMQELLRSSSRIESQKTVFEYDIPYDDRFLFKDLYNFSDSKWCCSPYRLSIRSFNPQSVSSYLLLFGMSGPGGVASLSGGGFPRGLSRFDMHKVQTKYEECFGIKGGKLPISVMAVDYREPDWVDPIGSTVLQELLTDHLASRIAPDDGVERLRGGDHPKDGIDGVGLHLNRSSSLEMFRGDIKGEVRTLIKQLLGAGAAVSGCFNNIGLDAWLTSFTLDDEAGRAATSVLLRSCPPLLGVRPWGDRHPGTSTNFMEFSFTSPCSKNQGLSGSEEKDFGLDTPKETYLSDEERVTEEMCFRAEQLHGDWEKAGYGIPYSSPEMFCSLYYPDPKTNEVFKDISGNAARSFSLLPNDIAPKRESREEVEERRESSARSSRISSGASSGELTQAALPATEKIKENKVIHINIPVVEDMGRRQSTKERDLTVTSDGVTKRASQCAPGAPSWSLMDKNISGKAVRCASLSPCHYVMFLLFACIEHNHKKLIPLLQQYPSVLVSSIRHPFTHDSLLTRLLKKAVEELIFLGELPAEVPLQSLSSWREGSNRIRRQSTSRSLRFLNPQNTLPLTLQVGVALWEESHRSCEGRPLSAETLPFANFEKTNEGGLNALERIDKGYRDPSTIPSVRSILDVAKALLDGFDIGSRFEPCAERETALSLASVIGHAPLVSRIVLPQGKFLFPCAMPVYGRNKGGDESPDIGNTVGPNVVHEYRLYSLLEQKRLSSMDKTTAPHTEPVEPNATAFDERCDAREPPPLIKSHIPDNNNNDIPISVPVTLTRTTPPFPLPPPGSAAAMPTHPDQRSDPIPDGEFASTFTKDMTVPCSDDVSSSRSSQSVGQPNTSSNAPYTLSSALENSVVRTMLATQMYWSEEDAPTLYALLNHMEGIDHQVEFLALAYPNIHPLPALWLAVQYVAHANTILYRPECNTAFWGNLLFAQYSGELDELPVSASAWNDLLRVLLPRSPAIPVYLIYSHLPGIDTAGTHSFRNVLRRRVQEDLHRPCASSELGDVLYSPRPSEFSQSRGVSERYPRLRINEPQFTRSVEFEKSRTSSASPPRSSFVQQSDVAPAELSLDQKGINDFIPDCPSSRSSSSATVPKRIDYVNNWNYIVKRISDFLKVSALVVGQAISNSESEATTARANKGKKADLKTSSTATSGASSSAVAGINNKENKKTKGSNLTSSPTDLLSGTLLLDVIEVATRYDHPEVVMDLVRLRTLMRDVTITPMNMDNSSEVISAEEQRIRREQEQSAILSNAVILGACHTLGNVPSLNRATAVLANLENGLWKELIVAKRIDLVAVAAGSQKVLKALYEDEITSPFLSVVRYDRINILNGTPENMSLLVSDENIFEAVTEDNYEGNGVNGGIPSHYPQAPSPFNGTEVIFRDSITTNTALHHSLSGPTSSAAWSKTIPSLSGELAGPSSIGSILTGCLREYVLVSLRALARRFPEAGPPLKQFPTLHQLLHFRPIDLEQVHFCRRCAGRCFIGTQEDRNAIAHTTWGVGGAAKMLQLPGSRSPMESPELLKGLNAEVKRDILELSHHSSIVVSPKREAKAETKGDAGNVLTSLTRPPRGNSLQKLGQWGNVRKGSQASQHEKKNSLLLPSSPTTRAPPVQKAPKPVFQLFLQTDWVVHPSQVLRSPRPSVQTVDMLVFLLEKRAPLSASALQMFFSASHFHNTWRSSRGEVISLNYQTASHQDTLLHILVMNDQYQLTEYFLTYALYYFCKWAFDDPSLRPGVFTVRECAQTVDEKSSPHSKGGMGSREAKGGLMDSGTGMSDGKEKNELMAMVRAATEAASKELEEQDHAREPATFLRMMLRVNRHGLAAFDYARSPNMVQLLQRFGSVPPSYRPNPQTFTRALGLFRMLQTANTIPDDHYFHVPKIILSSDHFLRCEDGKNHILINRQAGLKTNESNRIKQEKALLASFLAVANSQQDSNSGGPNTKGWVSASPSRAPAGKTVDQTGDGVLIRHLIQTQKITGTLVLPLILNEDVSLLHLGLCAHDDELIQLFGNRKNNLATSPQATVKFIDLHDRMSSLEKGSASGQSVGSKDLLRLPSATGSPTESFADKTEVVEETLSLSLTLSQGEQDAEEKELFSPYLLSLLPQEMTNGEIAIGEKGSSPGPQKASLFGAKLPPLRDSSSHRQVSPNSVSNTTSASGGTSSGGRHLVSDTSRGQQLIISPSVALGATTKSSGGGLQKGVTTRSPMVGSSGAPVGSKALPKPPLTQRDVITLLEKRQFIVYPLSLPAAPAPPKSDSSSAGQRLTGYVTDSKKPLKKRKNLASCAAMAEEVFLRHQMDLQHSNAEAMVEEADAINCAAFLVSMTPMQLMLGTLKLPGEGHGQPSAIGQQYYSIPSAKLSLYFSCINLPENVKTAAMLIRQEAAEVFAETNIETTRLLQSFYLPHHHSPSDGEAEGSGNSSGSSSLPKVTHEALSEKEDPLAQVVSVPLLQPQPFSSLKPSAVTNYPHMLDDWVDQFRLRKYRQVNDSAPNGGTRGGEGTRKKHKRSWSKGSANKKTKEKPLEESRRKGKSSVSHTKKGQGNGVPMLPHENRHDDNLSTSEEVEEEVEVSPIHAIQPVGGVASVEQQGLMRILLRQFSSSAGSKLSHDMGLHISPNYNVELSGDPIGLAYGKGSQKEKS